MTIARSELVPGPTSADGRVRRPHPALAACFDAYVGYFHRPDPRSVHYGVPSTGCTVIIALDEPIDVSAPDATHARDRYWLLASGLHTRPALIHTNGWQHGIQIDLTPVGARRLLGLPPAALGRTLVDHDDVPLGIDAAAYEQIALAPTWDARIDVLEQHLLDLAAHADVTAPPAETAEAWRLLAQSDGRIAVAEVAARVGWSRRHLGERFRAEYGLTPKEFARVVRFTHARTLAHAGVPLSEVAAEAGYADQAHLTREWRRLGGQPPRAALREMFPIVQEPS